MSPLNEALILKGAVLVATLEADLGPHRRISWFRILRTLVVVGLVIPLFLQAPFTHGKGLPMELAGIAAGVLCGAGVTALMRVSRSPRPGLPVSAAGMP